MSLLRGLLVLAIFAALWGAPPSVSAATNDLTAPQASPGSGTTTTTFVFRVRYDGRFAAVSVATHVAGLTIPMVLESGTPESGTWVAASLLPAGTWTVTFSALASRGPSPSITGPTVVVTPPRTPAPETPPTVTTPPTTPSSVPDAGTGEGEPAPTSPAAAPASGTEEPAPGEVVPSEDADDPSPDPGSNVGPTAPSSGTDPGQAREGTAPSGSGGGGAMDSTNAAPGEETPAAEADGPAAEGPNAGPRADPLTADDSADTRHATDALLGTVLLIGLAGVAAVAIVGTLMLLAARRRDDDEDASADTVIAAAASPAAPDALLERRTLLKARSRLSDDPIVAALGVDAEMAARRARSRAGQVNRGPGMRAPKDR